MSDIKDIKPESAAEHIKNMQASMGWQILLRYMAEEREQILTEGKKARREEKTIKTWAVLEGFDKFIGLADRIVQAGKKYQDISVDED